jgi:tetratricopeptide (TPR) repeat protein
MRASEIAPYSAEVKSSLGDLYQQRTQYSEARRAFLEALALNPQLLGTRINLSQTLLELGEHDAALEQLDAAIAFDASSFEAHLNRALALFKLGRFQESEISSERAIQLAPDSALAHANHGATLEESLQLSAALAAYDTALAIDPDNASVHVNKGMLLLLKGDLSEGWRQYDWRWKDPVWLKDKPTFSQPRWIGHESISGKAILVHNDQGLGDVIQFSRYVPMMVAAGAQVFLEVPKPLVGLLSRAETGATCLEVGLPRPAFDLHTTFSDLPLAFATDLTSVPVPTRLVVTENLIAAWSDRLGPKNRPRVGFVWKGNRKHKNDANRSIDLELLLPTLTDSIEAVSLQNELTDFEEKLLSEYPALRNFATHLIDFEETAALCSLVDLVVTVDTSVAHLAGSLGKATCILLPYLPDWRWLLNRTDTPWYASATLFRQPAKGNWQPVLDDLLARLGSLNLPDHSV